MDHEECFATRTQEQALSFSALLADSAWSPMGDYRFEDQVKDPPAFSDQLNLRGITLHRRPGNVT